MVCNCWIICSDAPAPTLLKVGFDAPGADGSLLAADCALVDGGGGGGPAGAASETDADSAGVELS